MRPTGARLFSARSGRARTSPHLARFRLDSAPRPACISVVSRPTELSAPTPSDEARFRALADLSPDILSILDREGRLVFNSAAAWKTHGYRAEDLQDRSTFEFIHPEDRAPLLARMPGIIAVTDDARKEDLFNAATAALACSGSVTTELALQSTPMAVAYRVGAITWFIARN